MLLLAIKKLRASKSITQQDLADSLGISRSAIAMWETGKSNPCADELPEIAKALDCTVGELYSEIST